MQWYDRELTALVCHTERFSCSLWEQEFIHYPSTVFMRQPGLQRSHDSTPDP